MKIPRIIFNFNDICRNGCPFCFMQFDHKGSGSLDLWIRIINRLYEFSPDLISFSGCDALYYDDFYQLLQVIPKQSLWALDTSLMFLNRNDFAMIYDKIDIIGTSIDDCEKMKIRQRYSQDRLNIFFNNINYVKKLFPNIIVHTLYSHLNKSYLKDIADLLVEKDVKSWMLYQFWEFDFQKNTSDFKVSEEEFLNAANELSAYCKNKIKFDYLPSRNRPVGYFFVSSIGNVYTNSYIDEQRRIGCQIELGNIFDEDIYQKWEEYCSVSEAERVLSNKIKREL